MLWGQNLSVQSLNQSNELSNEFNMHFCVDRTGFFWCSSRNGLNRFDGNKVEIFQPKLNQESLDPNITSQVFQDSQNRRWFTSSFALHSLSDCDESMQNWQFPAEKQSYYYAFHLERDSILWMLANGQLYALNINQAFIDQKPILNFDAPFVRTLTDSLGNVQYILRRLVIKSQQYLERIAIKNSAVDQIDTIMISNEPMNLDNRFIFFYPETKNSCWLAANSGLINVDLTIPEDYRIFKHKGKKGIYTDVVPWGKQYLWVSTASDGLLLFDKISESFIWQDSLFLKNGDWHTISGVDR